VVAIRKLDKFVAGLAGRPMTRVANELSLPVYLEIEFWNLGLKRSENNAVYRQMKLIGIVLRI
jgi:hypothetical protein